MNQGPQALSAADPSPAAAPAPGASASRSSQAVLFLAVFLSLTLYATWRTPIPGTNEPHYLTKARAFWDPTWCARDPFLQSTPVHVVFFTLLGGPAAWWGFPAAAWIGRILGWAGLAWGWTNCSRALSLSNLPSLTALWIYLSLAAIGNFSGEWMVGGTEGKVFSYAAVLLSLAAVMERRAYIAGIWGGIAMAFHPVVGAWHAIAVIGAGFLFFLFLLRTPLSVRLEWCNQPYRKRPYLLFFLQQKNWEEIEDARGLIAIFLGMFIATPGLIPATNVTRENLRYGDATEIQVFERLAHHLDPTVFPISSYIGYGFLFILFLLMWWRFPERGRCEFVRYYLIMTALFVLVGLAIGFRLEGFFSREDIARHLKYYPFRMFDIFLPLITALLLAKFFVPANQLQKAAEWILCGALLVIATFVIPSDPNPSHLPPEMWKDWKSTCAWIKEKSPADALFLTSNRGFAFKWYAERAEYFSYKDCPQDTAGILDWNQRQKELWHWFHEGFFEPELRKLRQETGCDYLVITRGTPCHLHPVYHNDSFVVYQIPPEWK